jgi:chromosome segregation protein
LRIRSLEISGFKSFPDRVTLSFPPGICAIVGPNGCGKSNVVDAIRWVMGEQNPRHLRGRSMEDVIFVGSETRSGVGMVEVILTLDNSDGSGPAGYDGFGEIEICRRLYRGGESEYRINRVACRLRDIVDFFLDTGVGVHGYTIVEQGQIAEIVSSRPQDRRVIIEEAAGIGKYLQRRRETERKLESTEQNLARVNDILGELRRQIGILERQSRKARRHRELSAQLRELELSVAREELDAQLADLAEASRELGGLRERAAALDGTVGRIDEHLLAARERKLKSDEQVRAVGERLHELRAEIQAFEARNAHARSEREGLLALLEQRDGEIASLRGQLEQHRAEEAAARRERSELDARLGAEDQEAGRRRAELDERVRALSDVQGRREALGHELIELSARAASLESRAEALLERRRDLERRLRAEEEGIEIASAELEEARREERAAETRLAEVLGDREALGRDLGAILGRRSRASAERAELDRDLEEARGAEQRLAARVDSLEEAQREAEGVTREIRERIGEPDQGGVLGVLADLLEVEEGCEAAVEAALEGRLHGIVVQSAQDVLAVLERLRASRAARATVMSVAPAEDALEAGFVPLGRPLLELVRAKPPYQGLLARLLRDTYLVADIREAAERYGLERPPAIFVTRAGELLDRSGAVTGGARAPLGAVARPGEIERKRAELEELVQGRVRLEAARGGAVERERSLERELENARSRYHSAELALLQHEKDLERARERRKGAEDLVEQRLTAKAGLLEEIERAEHEGADLREHAQAVARERETVERDGAARAEEIARESREVERLERALLQRQIEAASLRERREQLEATHRRIVAARAEGEDWLRRREEEVRAARERARDLEEGATEASGRLAAALEEEERLRVRQEEARSAFDSAHRAVEDLEQDLRTRAREREALRETLTAGELRVQERRLAGERTSERAREAYGVDLRTYEIPAERAAVPASERRAEIEEVRQKREALGSVYDGAIEEYEEVSERHRYLEEQKADIEASVERLRNAITRINRTSRARFRETFERVDEEFRKTFPKLFRGGRAYLALTEGEDVLEAGIEIVAQPPGKKLQSLNLLSGGEKALTALALLFAVFNVKPSPFFLLDEVDAALDDANVARFDELMREIGKRSQFLLITHNKSTIEVADTLYGVTMEEPGMSKIVSVELVS